MIPSQFSRFALSAATSGATSAASAAALKALLHLAWGVIAVICLLWPTAVRAAETTTTTTTATKLVTREEITAAHETIYRNAFEMSLPISDQLALRLTDRTDPLIILDVIELQIRLRVDGSQSVSLRPLAAAAVQLAQALGDTGRVALLKSYEAETLFWADESERGMQLALAALNLQRTHVDGDGQPRAPTFLFRQYMRYAAMLQTKELDDVAVDILKQAEKLLPRVDYQPAARILTQLHNAEVKLALGDVDGALAELLAAETAAQSLQYNAWVGFAANRRAALQLDQLRLDEAEQYYLGLLAKVRAGDDARAGFYANSQLATVAYLRNQPAQQYQFAKAALGFGKRFDAGTDLAYAWLELASAAAAKKGGLAEAKAAINEAERMSLPPRSIRRSLAIIMARAEISAAMGDTATLRTLLREQNELRIRQDIKRQQLQTRVALAVFDVNNRELKVQLLERSNAMNELQAREAESRNFWQRMAIIATSALLLVLLVASAWLYRRARDLQQRNQTDSLTAALSRAAILDVARRSYIETAQKGQSMAVCLLDFDRFKAINDEHGHEAGDTALRKTMVTIKHALRDGDAIGRVGGDEFLVIMVNAHEAAAAAVAERIRVAVNNSVVMHKNQRLRIRISAGVAATDTARADSATALINEADTALLAVKREGRNAVGVASNSSQAEKNDPSQDTKTVTA